MNASHISALLVLLCMSTAPVVTHRTVFSVVLTFPQMRRTKMTTSPNVSFHTRICVKPM